MSPRPAPPSVQKQASRSLGRPAFERSGASDTAPWLQTAARGDGISLFQDALTLPDDLLLRAPQRAVVRRSARQCRAGIADLQLFPAAARTVGTTIFR